MKFSFSTPLETEVLDHFYEGDLEHALEMFELFVSQIPLVIEALKVEMNTKNLEGCRMILHRIKPNFTMIGNTPLTNHCTKIEGQIKTGQIDFDTALPEISSIVEEMAETLKHLEKETTNLQQFLNK